MKTIILISCVSKKGTKKAERLFSCAGADFAGGDQEDDSRKGAAQARGCANDQRGGGEHGSEPQRLLQVQGLRVSVL